MTHDLPARCSAGPVGVIRSVGSHSHGTEWQPISSWPLAFDSSLSCDYPFKPPKVALTTCICEEFSLQVWAVMAAFLSVFQGHAGLMLPLFLKFLYPSLSLFAAVWSRPRTAREVTDLWNSRYSRRALEWTQECTMWCCLEVRITCIIAGINWYCSFFAFLIQLQPIRPHLFNSVFCLPPSIHSHAHLRRLKFFQLWTITAFKNCTREQLPKVQNFFFFLKEHVYYVANAFTLTWSWD